MLSGEWSGVELFVEFSLSSTERYIGSMAICSPFSSKRNVGIISTITFLLNFRTIVIDEKIY